MRILCLATGLLTASSYAATVSVSSPDGALTLQFSDNDAQAQYSLQRNGKAVIKPSKLGFTFETAAPMYRDFTVKEISRDSHQGQWEQPWGEQRIIHNHYNEVAVRFTHTDDKQRQFVVRARVFDDGIGFRYEVSGQGEVVITRELTQFDLARPQAATAYWIPGQGFERYEYVYRETDLEEVDLAHTPFTVTYDDGLHVAIHEAALVDYAGMSLQRLRGGGWKPIWPHALTEPWYTKREILQHPGEPSQ